jgi:acyl carrier protein
MTETMSGTQKSEQSLLGRLFGRKPAMPGAPPTEEAIRTWLVDRLAAHFEIAAEEIDVRETFSNYGLDSRTAVGLSGELERWLGRSLSPTLVWDYPTIELVAKHLASGASEVDGRQEP